MNLSELLAKVKINWEIIRIITIRLDFLIFELHCLILSTKIELITKNI